MRAEIEADGTLVVSPETGMDTYALRKWSQDNMSKRIRLTPGSMDETIQKNAERLGLAEPEDDKFPKIHVRLGDGE